MGVIVAIEPQGSDDTGVCDCCGRASRRVWGLAHADGICVAAYYVHWTLGHAADAGANFDFIVGARGEAASSNSRHAIALAYRLTETGPSVMVVDAGKRPVADSPLVGSALGRDQVIGTPFARTAFAIADAILEQDARVAELLGDWKIERDRVMH